MYYYDILYVCYNIINYEVVADGRFLRSSNSEDGSREWFSLSSEPDERSTFRFKLPHSAPSADAVK